MSISEKQPEGVQFTDRDGRVRISDLNLILNDNNNDNSNALDESFDDDKEYQKEFEKEGEDEDLATNKVQDNHFQLPFQHHHALVTDKPSKARSVGKMKKRTKKHKRQKIQQSNDSGEDDNSGDDDYSKNNNTTSKSGVGKSVDDSTLNLGVSDSDEFISETEETSKPPNYGIDMDLRPY